MGVPARGPHPFHFCPRMVDRKLDSWLLRGGAEPAGFIARAMPFSQATGQSPNSWNEP